MSIIQAAAFLAQQWPVFPCNAQKRPVTEHGLYDAVRTPEEATRLFRERGGAMIGVPTGRASDVVVVDIDVKDGRAGMDWLNANRHRMPSTRTHSTMSGGLHLLFQAPPGIEIRNSASRISDGVDIRGDGGYVIFPPSPGYGIVDETMPAPLPGWLLDLLTKRRDEPAPSPAPKPAPITSGDGTKYGLAALDDECSAIMNAGDGAKHDTLNRAVYSIAGLVAAGELLEGPARAALLSALEGIRHRCHDFRAAQKTFEDAWRAGLAKPRDVPPPRHSALPAPPPSAPLPDEPPEHWQAEPDVTPDIPDTKPDTARNATRILPIIRFADAAPALDAQDFVEGLLTVGGMSVIYGESNSGKTFFALDLALHVAAGRFWRDREVDQGFVLYLALEGSHAILNRVAAFKREHGLADAALPFAVVPVSLNLLDPEADAGAVVDTIKAVADEYGCPPLLTVVDTLARAIAGGNENAAEDMGSLIRTGDAIRGATGTHLMWIHHSGKDQAKGARGHSSLRAATDTEIEVVATGSARNATVTKQRDMECEGAFPFALRVVELGTNRRGKPITSCVIQHDDNAAPHPERFRPRLEGHSKRAYDILQDLVATSGETGHNGVPASIPSVPENWWRTAFYERAMPAETQDAKQKAFKRASLHLTNERFVCLNKGRIWIAR